VTSGLFDIAAKRAALTPDKVAFEDVLSGRVVTYRDLERNVSHAAGLLVAAGARPGDRIAVLCRNRVEYFELLLACGRTGTVLVPLNWRMPVAELRVLLADATPQVLFHGNEDADSVRARADPSFACIDIDDAGSAGYVARRDSSAPVASRGYWPGDDTWYLLYTSGTTGQPKAVIQTYGMVLVNYVNIGRAIDLRSDDTTVNFLPLFHTAGINLHTLPVLIAGGRVLVLPAFDAERLMKLITAGRLDLLFGVPAVFQQLSLRTEFEHADLARVRHWGCGGAPLPEALLARYAARGATVCNGMGMTETGPTVFLQDTDSARRKPGSVGKPQLLAEARIVDADGNDLPPGATGELWLKGPGITPGYWNRPQATEAAFAPGRWLRSGDLACRDADGDYYIVGRLKDMYISGGENVYPAEVENVLAGHPAVLEAAVVGVPDARWGEVGRAFVMVRPGSAVPEATILSAFCRERLAPYKVPRSFVVVADLPRTAAGKVQKHLLTRGAAPR
jgi:fatty-acyl-CoA synthase